MNTDILRSEISKLRSLKISFGEIALKLGITETKTKNLFYYKKKSFKCKPGAKCIIDKRKSLVIKRSIEKNNKIGVKVTCNSIISDTGLEISRRTKNNWMVKHDYHYKKVVQKVNLSNKHKLGRINSASEWLEKNIDFENVVFSDEKRFSLNRLDNWLFFTLII